jgi:ubiquitin-like protein 4
MASQYILPKMLRPMAKRQKLAPGQERSLTISLKSLRNPPLDIILKSQSPLTSILDLKTEVSSQSSIPVDKIRILYKKKPVRDAKVLKDLVGEEETSVEFSIMVMGGAASIKKEGDAVATAPVAQGTEILWTDEFWEDLKGFLTQRVKDQGEGQRVYGLFRNAWEASGAA